MRRSVRPVEAAKAVKTSGTLSFLLPNDSFGILKILILLAGYVIVTVTSGTPVAKRGSVMQSIWGTISLKCEGNTYKAFSPEMARYFNGLVEGTFPALRATAGATATLNAATDIAGGASVPYGSTGQYQNLYEELCVYCEMAYLDGSNKARTKTAFRTKGRGDTTLEMTANGMGNILGTGNTSVISYGDLSNLTVKVEIEELVEETPGEGDLAENSSDLRAFYQIETPKVMNAGMRRNRFFNLPGAGGAIAGIHFRQRANEAGSAAADAGALPNDLIVTDVELKVGDKKTLFESTWIQLKTGAKRRWGYIAPLASSVGEDSGFAGYSFVKNSMADAAPVAPGSNITLIVSTAAQATATDYGTANQAVCNVMVDYIGDV